MRVTVWKTDGESNERAITRFNKKVQGSKKIIVVRADRYHTKNVTKRHVRAAAISRENYRAKREKSRFY